MSKKKNTSKASLVPLALLVLAAVAFNIIWSTYVIQNNLPKNIFPQSNLEQGYWGPILAYAPLFVTSIGGWVAGVKLILLAFSIKIDNLLAWSIGILLGSLTGFSILWKIFEYFFTH